MDGCTLFNLCVYMHDKVDVTSSPLCSECKYIIKAVLHLGDSVFPIAGETVKVNLPHVFPNDFIDYTASLLVDMA